MPVGVDAAILVADRGAEDERHKAEKNRHSGCRAYQPIGLGSAHRLHPRRSVNPELSLYQASYGQVDEHDRQAAQD